MKRTVLFSLIIVFLVGLGGASHAWAFPSEDFQEIDGELFDDWEICRTRSFGEDGFYQLTETTFRPVIAFESLGENAALAYSFGQQIAGEYPDQVPRAEAIFRFVRDGVRYTPDIDQFDYDEFAQNADELAVAIDRTGVGYGDCEDSAVLLAVMYRGAGFRSALAIGKEHTAALVYLPGYNKATAIFELGGEGGWVWAEATGRNNPLGWVPSEYINVALAAYEITDEAIAAVGPPREPSTAVVPGAGGGGGFSMPFPFFGIVFFLWIISSMFRRRRRAG
jgi:hypothetical protein